MGKMRDDGWLSGELQEATADYEARLTAKQAAHLRAERITRSVRLFLLFVIFWMVGSAYMFRKDLALLLLTLDRSVSSATAAETQSPSTKIQQPFRIIEEVSKEADRRNDLMEQIQAR